MMTFIPKKLVERSKYIEESLTPIEKGLIKTFKNTPGLEYCYRFNYNLPHIITNKHGYSVHFKILQDHIQTMLISYEFDIILEIPPCKITHILNLCNSIDDDWIKRNTHMYSNKHY